MRLPYGRGVPLARRLIARDRARFAITVGGVGMAIALVLFLVALYDGVREEGNGWVASRPTDAWVAQRNTTNFIKASSILLASEADSIRADPAVAAVAPLLRLIMPIEHGGRRVTAILIGTDTASRDAYPRVVQGSDSLGEHGILLDWALARRLGVEVGDTVVVQGGHFAVAGITRGTNSVLTQLAFISISDAYLLLGFSDVASYFLVRASPGVSRQDLVARLSRRIPRASVIAQPEFADNNMQELRGGLIPLLATVAVLGGIVAVAVLTLLLYGSVMDRREDYALLKAVGASPALLGRLVFAQALAAVAGGLVVGLLAYAAAVPLSARFAPVVTLALALRVVLYVAAGALLVGAVGALMPLQRVARIHPAEVFRA